MKKQIVLIAMIIMLLAVPLVAADASLKASLLRYDPLPASPGQFVTAYVKLDNVGNTDATDVALRIQDQFPFSIAREGERTIYIGELKSQQSIVEEFKIKVDSTAFIGENQLVIEFTDKYAQDEWQESNLPIEVDSDEASLTITQVQSDEFLPGGDGTVSITIKNNEETVLRNIALQLQMETVSGTTTIDLPFIPLNSATEKRISRLNPGEITTISYEIKAYPSATPGYYKLPLSMSYVTDQGAETETEDYVGVIVQAVPELKILLDESTVSKDTKEGTITLKYINKGINDLKFLDSEIVTSENYEISSNSQDYIGDLDSDDYRSETYTIKINDESQPLKVKVSFKDENNKEYNQIIEVPLRFSETTEKSSHTGTVILVIILLAAGVVYFQWRRKKRR
ncbi:MAG: hypothetical protein KC535_01805 [Nanoarchaeota archaeon]|nr:hypothetical protein [Nanoarchaeota archaeon]